MNALFLFGEELIEKGKWSFLFAPISLCWKLFVLLKNWLYDAGLLPMQRVDALVVSVGNIVAGGTGKTPFTRKLAAHFADRSIAILTRGYGADETLLLQKSARVYVGKDRAALAKKAVREGAKLLLLDDGFQHRKLSRDLDILLLRGKDPLGKGHFLPWGFLRDHPSRLEEADFLFLQGIDFLHVPVRIRDQGGQSFPLQNGQRVGCFCGIANPSSFRDTLRALNLIVATEWILADHAAAPLAKLNDFFDRCKALGCSALLTTEKDIVKLPSLSWPLPLLSVEIDLCMTGEGREKWQKLVATIENKLDNRFHDK
ncbi:MAG: tetraacyldisaccharide 4'-kinase [Verrucomicrobiota bacterium]|nr:tetraacyldisaccharide 4'-kinase [Verrucomicrobiota bacterium]